MSQFEQKYYKHYRIKPKKLTAEDEVEYFEFWSWSRQYRLFEIIVILLLTAILLCLCLKCGGISTPGISSNTSLTMPSLSRGDKDIGGDFPSVSGIKSKDQSLDKVQTKELGLRYPVKVLPDTQKLTPANDKMVSIKDYMYYVHETKNGYPNFIDKETSRLILSKKPTCYKAECPVIGINKEDKLAYVSWLESITHERYTIKSQKTGFYLFKN